MIAFAAPSTLHSATTKKSGHPGPDHRQASQKGSLKRVAMGGYSQQSQCVADIFVILSILHALPAFLSFSCYQNTHRSQELMGQKPSQCWCCIPPPTGTPRIGHVDVQVYTCVCVCACTHAYVLQEIRCDYGAFQGWHSGLELHRRVLQGAAPWRQQLYFILAYRNRSDFFDLRLRCPSQTPEIASNFRDKTKQCCIAI